MILAQRRHGPAAGGSFTPLSGDISRLHPLENPLR